MAGRVISVLAFLAVSSVVAWFVWRWFFSPAIWNPECEDEATAERPKLAIVPTIPTSIPENQIPKIPAYLVGPFVFVDARLGVTMLAGWPVLAGVRTEVDPWIFRVHGDHWCTVRRATINDLETIENLKRYSRPLLLLRAQ